MKALIVASVASMIDQFNIGNIKLLQSCGYEVEVACNFNEPGTITNERACELKKRLVDLSVVYHQIDFSRNAFNIVRHLKAIRQMKHLLKENSFRLLHCHSPIGGFIARLAAKKYRKKGTKVIYTAHGFHFYKGAPKKNWFIYYPIEKISSRWTDVLITINQEDFEFAKKKMRAKKVEYVPGIGIDIKRFSKPFNKDEVKQLRDSLGVKEDEKMFLSVGELSKRKNHEIIIKALNKINEQNYKYFIVGKGDLGNYLLGLAKNENIENKVFLLGYRTDLPLLYASSDLFLFPSLQEGLPVALMEAVASKTPVVSSNIRGSKELVQKNQLFNPFDVEEVISRINEYSLTNYQTETNKNFINLKNFDSSVVNGKMLYIYLG